jgi:hypothetical protein
MQGWRGRMLLHATESQPKATPPSKPRQEEGAHWPFPSSSQPLCPRKDFDLIDPRCRHSRRSCGVRVQRDPGKERTKFPQNVWAMKKQVMKRNMKGEIRGGLKVETSFDRFRYGKLSFSEIQKSGPTSETYPPWGITRLVANELLMG